METAQRLQGMAISVRPSFIPAIPEVPLLPAPAFQAFPTAPPPRPSLQLLTAPMMGSQLPPPAFTPFTAQHVTPPLGGQPLGLVGAQYPIGLLPGIVPTQQLLLQHSAPPTAQHSSYPNSMHQ